jgi:hypothetical protein
VSLYTTSDCTGPAAATGTAAAFASPGLPVTVPANSTTTFYAAATSATNQTSPCSTDSVTFVNDQTAPALPTFGSTSPASPAQSTGPKILGSAEAGSTVTLYTKPDCTGSVAATGTAAAFAAPGLPVTVPANSTTTFYATATDVADNTSACSTTSITYVNDRTPPAPPTFAATSPGSPAPSLTPAILGVAEAGSTVSLYTTPDCSGAPTASGTAAAFGSAGIAVSVPAETSTTFRATATDAVGNTSACSTGSIADVAHTPAPVVAESLTPTLLVGLGGGPNDGQLLLSRTTVTLFVGCAGEGCSVRASGVVSAGSHVFGHLGAPRTALVLAQDGFAGLHVTSTRALRDAVRSYLRHHRGAKVTLKLTALFTAPDGTPMTRTISVPVRLLS